jgi:3-oxoacyl-[acyl-carrier-protein] synthase II
MRMALKDARLNADQIDYVNAHGTSTPIGDVAESLAIGKLFGAHAEKGRPGGLWVSSTKSMTGHLLGAAGALESAICALSLFEGKIPGTRNLTDPDPQCTLDYMAGESRERKLQHVVNNAFGFGGTNAALVMSAFAGAK